MTSIYVHKTGLLKLSVYMYKADLTSVICAQRSVLLTCVNMFAHKERFVYAIFICAQCSHAICVYVQCRFAHICISTKQCSQDVLYVLEVCLLMTSAYIHKAVFS